MIPLIADGIPENTLQSVISQKCESYEIIILQNGVSSMPEGVEVREENITYQTPDVPIHKFQIHRRGKGNALNIGIQYAKYDFVCVLDADCILEKNAIDIAMRYFEDNSVSAVGGKLKAVNDKENILTFCQKIEYMKTFNIWRVLFNHYNANCLISGAYGIFRKSELIKIRGYDVDTVGEDMELVLCLQEQLSPFGKKVIYAKDSVCYTEVPTRLPKLLHQRDRWQRGLLDCLIKHKKLIANPHYGLLGCAAIPYQILFELLGPIFVILHFIGLISAFMGFEGYFLAIEFVKIIDIPQAWSVYFLYVIFEMLLTCYAEYLERSKWHMFIIKILEAAVATVLGTLLSVPLAVARIWGMISFCWRRLVW